jgi:hypothetical protein
MTGNKAIQLDEDMGFQRWEWRVQRVGWVLMVLILVAAVLGFLGGPGFLNDMQWGNQGGSLLVEGRRIERHHRPTEMTVHLDKSAVKDGRVTFWIAESFLKKVKIESVMPEPLEMKRTADRVEMIFAMEGEGQVKLHVEPDSVGSAQGRMGIVGGGEVEVAQWVLP